MAQFIEQKRHHKLLIFLLLIFPLLAGIIYFSNYKQEAYAAISVDDTSAPPPSRTIGTVSWQHTTGTGSNRLLIVGLFHMGNGTAAVTSNGTALTLFGTVACVGNCRSELWYMKNPPPGTSTITITAPTGAIVTGGSITYNNVNQTTPFGTMVTNTGFSSPNPILPGPNITVPSSANQLVVDIIGYINSGTDLAAKAGQTELWKATFDPQFAAGSSSKLAVGTSTAMNWNLTTGTSAWTMLGVPINPAAAPTATPIPTATPTPPPTPTPPLSSGNIINLKFGINNSYPWVQTVCGDYRDDNGITNPIPAGLSALTQSLSCNSSGIAFTGDTSATFTPGTASNSNQIVGGVTYPEVYTSPTSGGVFTSYTYLNQKIITAGLTPTDLSSICTLTNCTLPANLPNGIYTANGDVALNAYTFPNNKDYVFLINGNLTVKNNIIVATGSNSTAFFSTAGNIIIPAAVGNAAAVTTANLAGIFSTDRSLIVQSNNNCTDLRLAIEGTVIVNAGRTGGALQNSRDLCGNNPTTPSILITQRLDFVLNIPEFLRTQVSTLDEIAP